MSLRPRTALLVVLGNAAVMGMAGVRAPIGWILMPGIGGDAVHVLRCGGPEILAVPATPAGLDRSRCVVVDAGPAHLPIGLGREAPARRWSWRQCHRRPDNGAIPSPSVM